MTDSLTHDTTDHADTTAPLSGRVIAFLTADEAVERVELTQPRDAVLAAGATVRHASPSGGPVQLFDHLDHAGSVDADVALSDLDLSDVAGIVLPGGVGNPDQLRLDADAVRLLTHALEVGVPIAVVCHGPWTLIETGKLPGRTLTSWPSLRTDLTNAGASWVDQEVVVCESGAGPLVSSRKPDDLEAFSAAAIKAFAMSPVR